LELQVRICSGIVFELAVSTLMPFLTEWACGQSHKCVVLYIIYNCCVRAYRVYNPDQKKEEHSNSLVIAFTETWMTIPPTVAHGRNVLIKFLDCKRLLNNHRSCLVVPRFRSSGFFRWFLQVPGFPGTFPGAGWLPTGSILCFLPGWWEIRQMEERLAQGAQASKIWAIPWLGNAEGVRN